MTFAEIYLNEKAANGGRKPDAFLARIAQATKTSVSAVYQWATGWRNPSAAAAELASRELGVPAEELFNTKRQIA